MRLSYIDPASQQLRFFILFLRCFTVCYAEIQILQANSYCKFAFNLHKVNKTTELPEAKACMHAVKAVGGSVCVCLAILA